MEDYTTEYFGCDLMPKILIVEDEYDIAENLQLFFQHQDFETRHVDDGALVIAAAKTYQPDLIVMDLMLPNRDGLDLTKEIRTFSNVPIVMLTAKVEQVDKLVGLESGADDYMCKPFDAMELILRVKAILSRTEGKVQFSNLALFPDNREVTFKGEQVGLSALEFNLFELLYNAPERIYSREQIIEFAYPQYRDITDRTIDSHVKNIRKKFKEVGAENTPIQSVYGAGYRFSPI